MLFSWPSGCRIQATGSPKPWPAIRFSQIRGDVGKIRAFHNVCCRRGAQLLAEGAGDCSKLVVWPYHSWSYKRDGRLNKAADFGGDANFDPDPCALHAVGAKEWRGLVFIRLKRGGPDVIKARPIHEMAADYPLEQQHYFMAKNRDIAVDRRIYDENYLECYYSRATKAQPECNSNSIASGTALGRPF
jgi:choline monooxygenase